MAIIAETGTEGKLYQPTDPYHYITDRRPLKELMKNDQAINAQLEDVVESDCEVAVFIVESPTAETNVCGPYLVRNNGNIIRVVLSGSTMGGSGNHIIDVNKNASTIFTTQGNRPTLPFDDSDKVDEVLSEEINVTTVVTGDILTVDLDSVQTGSPRWLRVEIWIRKDQDGYDFGDYSVADDDLGEV